MPDNDPQDPRQLELQRLLGLTNALATELLEAAETEADQDAVLAALEESYLSLGRNVNQATGLGCPGSWVECDDGSCVESASDCRGGTGSED